MVLAVQAVSAAVTTGSTLTVVLSDQSPYPVSPGETVTIGVQIQNSGNDAALGKTIEINPKSPFSLLPGEDKTTSITRIAARGSHSLTYRLEVASTTPTNTYPIEFMIYSGTQKDVSVISEIDINVEGQSNIIIDEITSQPADLEPGAIADLYVELLNIGTGTAGDLQLSMNSSDDKRAIQR